MRNSEFSYIYVSKTSSYLYVFHTQYYELFFYIFVEKVLKNKVFLHKYTYLYGNVSTGRLGVKQSIKQTTINFYFDDLHEIDSSFCILKHLFILCSSFESISMTFSLFHWNEKYSHYFDIFRMIDLFPQVLNRLSHLQYFICNLNVLSVEVIVCILICGEYYIVLRKS